MIKKKIITILHFFLSSVSFDSLVYVYANVFKPKPLRLLVNFIIKKLIPKSVRLQEGVLKLNPNDPVVSGAVAFGVYEPFFTALFRNFLKPDTVFVDVGANIGYYSIIASKYITDGVIISFEPDVINKSFLAESAKANGIKNITIVETAVGDKEGVEKLYIHSFNKGKHTFVPDSGHEYVCAEVPVTSLDIYLPKIHITKVDIVKIDVEGWEGNVILGMEKIIIRDHPTILFEFAPIRIKSTGISPGDILSKLIDNGYSLYVISEKNKKIEIIENNEEFVENLMHKNQYENICALYKK